jgi:hypothetical protein
MSRWHSGSENFRPMRRFVAKRVFSGLTTACRFAEMPTNRSPLSVNATTDGVVLAPKHAMRISHADQPFRRTLRTYLQSFLLSLESFPPSPQLQSWLCLDIVSLLRQRVARDRSSAIMDLGRKHTQVNTNDLALDLLFSAC